MSLHHKVDMHTWERQQSACVIQCTWFTVDVMKTCHTWFNSLRPSDASKLTIIGSDYGLSPGRRQPIIWTNAGILFTGPLGINLWNFNRNSNIFIEENTFENVCKMLSILSWPQCVKVVTDGPTTGGAHHTHGWLWRIACLYSLEDDCWPLTHWGRVTHIGVVKLTIIGSDNGLSPGRRQAIIWTNAGILLIGPLETNFIEILIGIQTF